MPGSMPATSQLDWLSSMTAMIVLFWSRATRDLLKSFSWGIAALHRSNGATKLPFPRRPPHSISWSHSWMRVSCDHLRLMQPQPIEVDQIDVGPETRCDVGTIGEAEEIGGLARLTFADATAADRNRARRAGSRARMSAWPVARLARGERVRALLAVP